MVDPGTTDDEPRLVDELRELGRQVGETLETAWNSEERKGAERELRAGARAFAEEVGRAWEQAKGTRPTDIGPKARRTAVDGLRWMSAELAELADRFTRGGGSEDPRQGA